MKVWHALGRLGVRRDGENPVGGKPVALHGRGLAAARVAVIAFAAVALWFDLTHRLHAVRETDGLWLAAIGDEENTRAALAAGGIALAAYLANAAAALVTSGLHYGGALVLLRRRPREIIALLVAVFLIASATPDFPPNLFALMGTEPIRATLGLIVTYCFPVTIVVLFYVFPDGRFTPRWTIIPAASWALLVAWDFFVARSIESPGPWADALTFGTLLASAVAAQIYRYRRVSGPIERQQTKWFVGGLGVTLVTFMASNIFLGSVGALGIDASGERVNTAWTIVEVAFGLSGFCVPVGLTVAVLKYRLFGIDTILNRALVYGGLTAAVIGLYVLIVGYLGALLRTGGNPAISLVATGVVAVLFQPLRGWLQRGANRLLYGERDEPYAVISHLGRQLEGALAPDAILPTIVRTVAGALKLPYAAITLGPDDDAPVAAAVGSATPAPLRLPLTYQGEAVGALLLAPRAPGEGFSQADHRLLDDLARQAGVAARAVRLADEARRLAADLQASRERLVLAREEERHRLRRDLHDGLGPRLAGLTLRVETARDLLAHDPVADGLLADLADRMAEAVADIRRVVYALRPPALDDLGLVGAVRQAAEGYQDVGTRFAVEAPATLLPLPAAVESAAYRIAQEALTNVARHA